MAEPAGTLDGNPMGIARMISVAKLDVPMVTLALVTGVMEGMREIREVGW